MATRPPHAESPDHWSVAGEGAPAVLPSGGPGAGPRCVQYFLPSPQRGAHGRREGDEEALEEGRQEGDEEAREEGREEGRQEGEEEAREKGRQQVSVVARSAPCAGPSLTTSIYYMVSEEIYIYIYIYLRMYVYIYICTHVCVLSHIPLCMYKHTHVYIYIHILYNV